MTKVNIYHVQVSINSEPSQKNEEKKQNDYFCKKNSILDVLLRFDAPS